MYVCKSDDDDGAFPFCPHHFVSFVYIIHDINICVCKYIQNPRPPDPCYCQEDWIHINTYIHTYVQLAAVALVLRVGGCRFGEHDQMSVCLLLLWVTRRIVGFSVRSVGGRALLCFAVL